MITRRFRSILPCFLLLISLGCAGGSEGKDEDFFTSGSTEADQRAEQRVAKTEQLRGESGDDGSASPAAASENQSLYDRLGGEAGIQRIVDDFVNRALADPRVNWERKGVESGGLLRRDKSMEWQPAAGELEAMKKHIGQFLALATGGPTEYQGRDMKEVHKGMKITNAEFDAAVGDLKATLDKLGIPTDDQKELLAVVESTRTQVVEER